VRALQNCQCGEDISHYRSVYLNVNCIGYVTRNAIDSTELIEKQVVKPRLNVTSLAVTSTSGLIESIPAALLSKLRRTFQKGTILQPVYLGIIIIRRKASKIVILYIFVIHGE
jgi:hypothetical protein